MHWAGSYVGAPFLAGGRGPVAFDCWGLVRDVYRTCVGVDLPRYGEVGSIRGQVRAITTGQDGHDWAPVESPQEMDVCVMRIKGSPRLGHVGIFVQGGRILHTEVTTGAVLTDIHHPLLQGRIAGYRRHRACL